MACQKTHKPGKEDIKVKVNTHVRCESLTLHSVKTFGLVQTIFWSSQLHACCVRDTLQNFKRDASYLNQSV